MLDRTRERHCRNETECRNVMKSSDGLPHLDVILNTVPADFWLLSMKIPAGRAYRFEIHPRLPERFGNKMNNTIFYLERSRDT